MSYEAWRITYQSSEQAARAAYTEWQVKLEEVKKWMALAEAAALGFEACQRRQERTDRPEKHTGYCTEGDRCVCGGDTPGVRAGCANWVPPNAQVTGLSVSEGPVD